MYTMRPRNAYVLADQTAHEIVERAAAVYVRDHKPISRADVDSNFAINNEVARKICRDMRIRPRDAGLSGVYNHLREKYRRMSTAELQELIKKIREQPDEALMLAADESLGSLTPPRRAGPEDFYPGETEDGVPYTSFDNISRTFDKRARIAHFK